MKVYKYKLEAVEQQYLKLPQGSRILKADAVEEELFIWALVDPEKTVEEHRIIHVYPTGVDVDYPDCLHHIDTVLMLNGALVWHVFECMPNAVVRQ